MIGAIAGDTIGSVHEFVGTKTTDFVLFHPHCRFTDDTVEEVLAEAKRSAEPTHNQPEGIKGAQATAAAIFLARRGKSKQEIRASIASLMGYDLDRRLDDIR